MNTLTNTQMQILQDLYEKSNQGVSGVDLGRFTIRTQEDRAYIDNLKKLQEIGFITGIGDGVATGSGEVYVLVITITAEGLEIIKEKE